MNTISIKEKVSSVILSGRKAGNITKRVLIIATWIFVGGPAIAGGFLIGVSRGLRA